MDPITGCTKNQQAVQIVMLKLCLVVFQAMGQTKYSNGFELTLHEESLKEPLHWKTPHTIFVCSMSDLFHENVPFDFIEKVMEIINKTPWHRYQLLTKRAERMVEYFQSHEIPQNAWLGVNSRSSCL